MENQLIERILENAENAASAVIAEAERKAEEQLAEADAFATRLAIENNARIEANRTAIFERAKSVAELDAAKLLLAAKVRLLDRCFDAACREITGLDDERYLAYIKKLLSEYAEDGDEVIVSARDAKRITAEFVRKVSSELRIKLKLSKAYGNFSGGVVLAQGGIDKNLTVEMQLAEKRNELTPRVLTLLRL